MLVIFCHIFVFSDNDDDDDYMIIYDLIVYEIRENGNAEKLFMDMVMEGRDTGAEILGKTVGLDLLRLYDIAAHHFFHAYLFFF